MSPGEALKQFCCEVPVLWLIGTQHMVDEDVQLVCKYLRALSIRGTKGMDKLYREGEITCMSIVTPYRYLTVVLCINL
jgi:hypothetical protein